MTKFQIKHHWTNVVLFEGDFDILVMFEHQIEREGRK